MKGHMQDGKFHPHSNTKGVRKSRDQQVKTQGVRMKRYNVCDPFLEDPASHKPDDTKHTNQIMYSLGDESCASVLTDEEFSMLLTDDQVANTFSPIGDTAKKWQEDEVFRKKILDRALELIEEQKKGERKAREDHPTKVGNAIVISTNTDNKRLKKLRIELLNNIPTKSDSNKVVENKRRRFNEIADEMAEIVGLET